MRIAPLLMTFTLVLLPALHINQARGQLAHATGTNASSPDVAAIRDFYRAGLQRNGIVGSTLVLFDDGGLRL